MSKNSKSISNKKSSNYMGNFKKNNFKSVTISQLPAKVFSENSFDPDHIRDLYLPDCDLNDENVRKKLSAAEKFLSDFPDPVLLETENTRYFSINVQHVTNIFTSKWSNFESDLENYPNTTIGIFGFAMEKVLAKSGVRDPTEKVLVYKKLNARFTGFKKLVQFQDIKSFNYGKFVSVVGIVVRASDVKPFCTHMAFECPKCKTIQVALQDKGCYSTPSRCIGTGCHVTSLKPVLRSPLTQTIPWKVVRLQELSLEQSEGGRVPRSIECELTCDLSDYCTPGDIVSVSGIVSANNINERKTTAGRDASAFILTLQANSVDCLKGKDHQNGTSVSEACPIEAKDIEAIKEIHNEKNVFRLVVQSFCPNIFGHELVKAGIVLALFGGSAEYSEKDDKRKLSVRENSHILIVGDPGLGKSQMLLATHKVSPRGVYVCGNTTTSSGLTATIVKEAGGDSCLEAGALVLADQGHCCIDEFDKMMKQHSALLEAMEQQTISMAKSGVVCTLPARTSIIAAANPSGGHYNKGKTVSENLKIDGPLLSRFDLVFIIQDKPNQDVDHRMTEHIMGMQANVSDEVAPMDQFSQSSTSVILKSSYLTKKLQIHEGENISLIPQEKLRKYISYARRFSQPILKPEVSDILQKFYSEMRKQDKHNKTTPVTTRQLESLIRLTKARARLELRSICEPQDALDVVEIMKYSMQDTFSDELGNIDFDRSIHGSGMSNKSQAMKLVKILTETAVSRGDDCFSISEIKDMCIKIKIGVDKFQSVFERLNEHGYLLKKGFQLYQIQTV